MPIIYAVLVALAMIFPEIGHEAGPAFESNVVLDENALISEMSIEPDIKQSRAEVQAVIRSLAFNPVVVPPIMKKIAMCESNDQHYTSSGQVLTGKIDSRDIGRYQINKGYWQAEAASLGYDIYTEAGNEAFAVYLYNKQGTRPWNSSKSCWSRM